jgi:hypothetical protein
VYGYDALTLILTAGGLKDAVKYLLKIKNASKNSSTFVELGVFNKQVLILKQLGLGF